MDTILFIILLFFGGCGIVAGILIPDYISYKKAIIKSFPEAGKGYRLIHISMKVYDYLYIDNKVYRVIFSGFPYKIVFIKELCKDDLPVMENEINEQLYRNDLRKYLK